MQPAYYIPILVLFLVLFFILRTAKLGVISKRIHRNKTEDRLKMVELAKNFIGKECLISAFDSNHQFEGIVRQVSDGGILIEKNGNLEAINLDFVIRIREFPKTKKGKKKSIVLD